jgi:hypothetical protein
VTGRYQVVDSFPDGFIGEVRVVNRSSRAVGWQVRLDFPAGVGAVRASWVDGSPPPTVSRSGQRYVFTGATPLGAGATAPLRFHLTRTGTGNSPTRCQVNSAPCTARG